MNLFTNEASVDDIDIKDLDSKRMNPAALRYFFMRERIVDKYDSTKRHPCFFGADYTRDGSRYVTCCSLVIRSL
jgi:hypothetical protein